MRRSLYSFWSFGIVCTIATMTVVTASSVAVVRAQLRPPSSFTGLTDKAARSRALFSEAAKVITHPRCVNCHPAGDRPLQGDDHHIHEPPALRGDAGFGIPGLSCAACHGERHSDVAPGGSYQSIPGHPRWGLAPIEMAWAGKTVGQICEQIKDQKRNGGRDLQQLHEHMAHDDLVAYGWAPGAGRDAVPGTQETFGALIKAWIDSGAACPTP
jgi:hypothetical protein